MWRPHTKKWELILESRHEVWKYDRLVDHKCRKPGMEIEDIARNEEEWINFVL